MSRVTKGAAALLTTAVVGVGLFGGAASSAETTPKAYTVVEGDGGCELQEVDLATGALTDLPAAASPEACVSDLAVGVDGVVYGILPTGSPGPGTVEEGPIELTPLAAEPASFVTFAADGTPSADAIVVEDADSAFVAFGGVAIAADGTVYLHLVTDEPGCDSDAVCLYTYDATTGAASFVGSTGVDETFFGFLTSCTAGLRTIAGTGGLHGTLGTESTTTGAVTLTAPADATLVGADCQSTSDTLYALAAPDSDDDVVAIPLATEVALGTVDPSTGTFTEIAPLSDPSADVRALAVAPGTVTPITTTTTSPTSTTTPAPGPGTQAGGVVRPAFTG